MELNKQNLGEAIESANTGLDAIQRAPIVEHDTGVKCLRIQDISQQKEFSDWGFSEVRPDNYERFKLLRDDILIARTGAYFGVNRLIETDVSSVYNNGLIRIRTDQAKYFPKFVYYLIQSGKFKEHINAIAFSTSAQPNMKIRDLLRFEFIDLPLPEQKAIAHILGTLDDKIELNRRMNATLEGMAQALFKSWFVDFDPVIDNALAAGNPIPDELAPRAEVRRQALANGTTQQSSVDHLTLRDPKSLFPAVFQFSEEFGWIPEGWEVKPLGDITTELRRGISPKYIEEDGVRVINQRCIKNHTIIYSNARRNDTTKKKVDGRLLQIGDLLINSTGVGTLGRMAQIQMIDEPTVIDSHVTVARPDLEHYMPFTFGRMMISIEAQVEMMGHGSTGQTELSRADLSAMPVFVPPQIAQELAENLLSEWAKKTERNSDQSNTLIKLRDTLLPKLISGELCTELLDIPSLGV